MLYIVGLGNPGDKYTNTRHNVGWMALDMFRTKAGLGDPVASLKYSGKVVESVMEGEEVTLLYPDTFMNNSGTAVVKLVPKGAVGKLIVVYDDVDLPVGEFKVSHGKGSGGHNGIESIIKALGSKDFVRIRVGIAPKSFWTGKAKRPSSGQALSKHVLGAFSRSEAKQIESVLERAVDAISYIQKHGPEAAMNEFN